MRQRTKISFLKPDIDEAIENLRKGNDDLERLLRLIDALQKADNIVPTDGPTYTEDLVIVQKASKQLHEVLTNLRSCTAEHSVAISLEISQEQRPSKFLDGSIGFDLAWSCIGEGQSVEDRFWMTVKTLLDDTKHTCAKTSKLSQPADQPIQTQLTSALRSVQNHASRPAHSSHSFAQMGPSTTLQINAPSIRSICTDVRPKRKERPDNDSEPQCIGMLQDSSSSRHLIFPSFSNSPNDAPLSLQDALSQARSLLCGIPPIDRMRLARTLAVAVLQLHPTPWLNAEWRSKDILFFGIKDLDRDPLPAPFLSVRDLTSGNTSTQQMKSHDYSALGPNMVLYSLGIILIELAFERPLIDLQEPSDIQPGDPASFALHKTAVRLADKVGKKIHVRYETVVKRCLRCNFETGSMQSELGDSNLQKAFYKLVVCELERCFRAAAMF